MKLITLLFLTLFMSHSFGMNLAKRVHSLNCHGELSLQSTSSFWMNERIYLNIAVDNHEDFYLEEAYFNGDGDFVINLFNKTGWNLLSLKASESEFEKLDLQDTFGLLDSPFNLTENGVFLEQLNCKIVWKRWN